MQIIMVFIALGIFIHLFVNAGQKLFLWFRPIFSSINPVIFGILYGIIVISILVLFVLSRIPNSKIPRVVFWLDHYALGVIIYIMLFVNFSNLVLFLLQLFHLFPRPMPWGITMIAGMTAIMLSVVLSIYGSVHASMIQVKNYNIQLQNGKTKTDSMKIALISDLHIGYIVDEKHIRKVVDTINTVEPDLVCIAGDIFDGDITSVKHPSVLQSLFQEIKAPYGVYACLGNHDAGGGYEGMLEFLNKAEIHLLQDEMVLIDDKIILAGRKDSDPIGGQGEKRIELEESIETEKFPRIVLDHKPENIKEYNKSTDLIFSGHTHQGQLFPFNFITNVIMEANYGHYQSSKGKPQAIITSGVGTWGPPFRVGTDSEVAVIQLTFPIS